jgi:hypothetical protein
LDVSGFPTGRPTPHHQAFFWRRCQGMKKNNLSRQLGTVKHFSGTVAREKEDFCKESLLLPIFYFVIVLLTSFTLFLFVSFY